MKRGVMLGIVLGVVAVCPALGFAANAGMGNAKMTLSLTKDYTPSPWTHEVGYGQRAMGKLGFGAKNLLLGWTSLFTEPHQAVSAGDNLLVGIGKGLKNGLENELGGVVHLVTFPLTEVDAPLPDGGVHVL